MREIQPGNLMIKKFKSIQSVIFAVLSVLLLGAVIINCNFFKLYQAVCI